MATPFSLISIRLVIVETEPPGHDLVGMKVEIKPRRSNPNGKAIYNTGKTENFGPKGVWKDNPKLGQSAKIYDASQKWIYEWVAKIGATHTVEDRTILLLPSRPKRQLSG